MKRVLIAAGTLALLLVAACSSSNDCVEGDVACILAHKGAGSANADGGANASGAANTLACTVTGKPHIGLGGVDVAATSDGVEGADRARVKPYSALVTEYSRVLGANNAPSSVQNDGPTFGIPSDRWYYEPIASAVFMNTAFDVAFEGCQNMTTSDATFATAPTSDSALTQCTTWARTFWSRDATPDQLTACVGITSDASVAPETPQRRWAYACATLLTASNFLTF